MIKAVTIDGQNIEINSSTGWLYVYRNRFGRDILPDIMPIIESVLSAASSLLQDADAFDRESIIKAMDNDALVDAFIKLAGMEVLTVFNVFWAMVRNADPKTPEPATFFNSFERFPIDEIIPTVFGAVVDSTVSSKNAERLRQEMKKARERMGAVSTSTLSPSLESIEG